MSTPPARLQYLLQQYADDNCTRQELLELLQAMEQAGHDEALHTALLNIWQNITHEDVLPAIDKEKIYNNIIAAAPAENFTAPGKIGWWKIAAAAVVVLALSAVLYVYFNKPSTPPQKNIVLNNTFKSNKAALISKAILTLANGSDIVLDDVQTDSLTLQDNTTLIKSDKRTLVYKANAAGEQTETVQYHTLTTSAGSPYQLTLPDGSQVWLNAASSIRFPIAFSGNERKVAITGEAYFEIKLLTLGSGQKMPFKVLIANADGEGRGEIEVLGTHFNINAYEEEAAIKTTLVEGKVKVSSILNGESAMLQPGQQVSIRRPEHPERSRRIEGSQTAQISQPIQVQTANFIAWKNEELVLNDNTMAEAARMISRKYNVQFVFKNPHVADCRGITTSFPKGESIENVMEVICNIIECKYQIKNKEIILSGKGCD